MLSPLFLPTHFYPWTFLCCCGAVFGVARVFNGDLSKWQVREVTNMYQSTYTHIPPLHLQDRSFFRLLLFPLLLSVALILFLNNALSSFCFPTHFYPWTFLCCCGAVFAVALAFNGDISTWQVGKVTDMYASTFTLPLPSPRSGLF